MGTHKHTYLIIGCGYFGSRAAEKLSQKNSSPKIIVVDKSKKALLRVSQLPVQIAVDDAIIYLSQFLLMGQQADYIIPAVPLHLAFEFILFQLKPMRIKRKKVPTLQIVDRLKDMVNVSGYKVYTTEVDEVLFHHPAIEMAAAFGIPDVDAPGSERVMAVVALSEAYHGSVTEQDVRDLCRQHLPPYAVPTIVEFHDELPLTVSEKVFKKALRVQAIARMMALKEG